MSDQERFVEIDDALKRLQESIDRLEDVDVDELTTKVDSLRGELYESISRWGSVELARHEERPGTDEYIKELCSEFMELHGDRQGEDDPALIGGLALIDEIPVVIIAHRKHSCGAKDYARHHFGMAGPSGHHKAVRLMRLAEKFGRPVITLVDTPGAYPVPDAEDKGQAFSIAECIATIAGLQTPVIACVVGEAGSGGALALGFGDRLVMLENAFYSAISPEGFSSIVYGDASQKEKAAEALKGTGRDLYAGGIVDYLVREPVGGAHNDSERVVRETAEIIRRCLHEVVDSDLEDLLARRQERIKALHSPG